MFVKENQNRKANKKKWRVFSTQTINYLNVFGVPKTIFLCNSILSLATQKKKKILLRK